ncbi:outer membrane protein [Helicobacter cetorum]|nr:outer membrane protein [Helicobacter cetorum]
MSLFAAGLDGRYWYDEPQVALKDLLPNAITKSEQTASAKQKFLVLEPMAQKATNLGSLITTQAQNLENQIHTIKTLTHNRLDLSSSINLAPFYMPSVVYDERKQQLLQKNASILEKNPFAHFSPITSQNDYGLLNGLGLMAGYKQFFGKKRAFGIRYYGFLDYNHTQFGFFNSGANIITYGVGTDLLYNFINDKRLKNALLSIGLFGGIQVGGTSWLSHNTSSLTNQGSFFETKTQISHFQVLVNTGIRFNLTSSNKGTFQHGFELGVKFPPLKTPLYSFLGTKLTTQRTFSVFINYSVGY